MDNLTKKEFCRNPILRKFLKFIESTCENDRNEISKTITQNGLNRAEDLLMEHRGVDNEPYMKETEFTILLNKAISAIKIYKFELNNKGILNNSKLLARTRNERIRENSQLRR